LRDLHPRTRVAMRYAALRAYVPEPGARPHYVRLKVKVHLPARDPYLQTLLSTAARASDSVPFIRRTEPVQVTLDLPIPLEVRKKVIRALSSLPFVESVLASSGPPIR